MSEIVTSSFSSPVERPIALMREIMTSLDRVRVGS